MAEDKPKYDGILVRLGGQELIVPSLSVGQARALWPEILDLDKGVTAQNMPQKHEQSLKIILAAVNRNYPEINREQLEEWVDLGNIRKLLLIVAGQSGLEPYPGGERPVAEPTVVH